MIRIRDIRTPIVSAAALAIAAPALAQSSNVADRPDGAWIALSGEVAEADANEFTLDHGQGMITVEMDDFDPDMDAAPLMEGDKVTVHGFVDDGFFEERSIEASSVWNERSNSLHHASGIDEESIGAVRVAYPAFAWEGPGVTVSGQVVDVSGREFELMTGEATRLTVDTADMPYDPLDAEGAQKVVVGDRVAVTGRLEDALFADSELSARSLMVLRAWPSLGG